MKYKLNDDGTIAVDAKGNPIRINAAGEEYSFDALGLKTKLTETMAEAKKYRQEKATLKTELEAIPEGIRKDPNAAAEAIVTVANLDDKHKADMDKIKSELKTSYDTAIQAKDSKIEELTGKIFTGKVTNKFATTPALSKTIFDKTREVAESFFGKNFKVDDNGTLTATGHDGNTIYSSERPGEPASFDEAVGILINTHPAKDSFLAPSGQKGSGNPPSGDGQGDRTPTSGRDKIKAGLSKL